MKQANWNGKDVLLVQVAEGAKTFKLNLVVEKDSDWDYPLPEGDWQFAFADPLHPTEQEAGEWVGKLAVAAWGVDGWPVLNGYKSYTHVDQPLTSSIKSLHSRIRSEGFQHPERVVMLIKK